MFDYIYDNAWPNFNYDFIDSLREQYERKGLLSEKQIDALRKIYEAVMKRAK